MGKKYISRTVQYWQLVDGRTGEPRQPFDWWGTLVRWTGEKRAAVRGVPLVGNVHPVPGHDEMLGVVLSSEKDYVPNQRNDRTGEQEPLRLSGEEWSPVDNLFVAFLPHGNLIGVIAESVSSTRAGRFAEWLNRVLGAPSDDPDFSWAAVPVIDPHRAELISSAAGLQIMTLRAPYGTMAPSRAGLIRHLGNKPTEIKEWEIEITIKASSKNSEHKDRQQLLEYFDKVLGGMDVSQYSKAYVKTSGGDVRGPTEIDLINHRVTRKTQVQIETEGGRSHFAVRRVLENIYKAYLQDEEDLVRIVQRS